ncbi:MAG TPA: cytochrome b/b6 domain-containing protein [Candidatus Methanoperedens sp.]
MKILRFDVSSRALHWSHALVFFWMLVTGIALFLTPKSLLGNPPIKMIHLYASIPFILLPAIIYIRRSALTRNDIKELMEWSRDDVHWFIELFKKNGIYVTGKFNGGQKANFLVVMLLVTGLSFTGYVIMMRSMFSRSFVETNFVIHDSLAVFSIVLLGGHIALALYYREPLKCIIYGKIDAAWAKEHYPNWISKKKRGASTNNFIGFKG